MGFVAFLSDGGNASPKERKSFKVLGKRKKPRRLPELLSNRGDWI
jgi:hypothetical protein